MRCPLLHRKTQKLVLHCRYKDVLDFNALDTLEHCIECMVLNKRYLNECFFFILKDLRKKRNKKLLVQ